MRFRSVMADAIAMREFYNVTTALARLSREAVLRLSSNKIYFIIIEDSIGPRPPNLWCQLERLAFFSDFLIEGVDDNHRDIYLTLDTGNFARCLSTLKQSPKNVKIKLTKKQTPCLTVEIETLSQNLMHTRHITHDIPVVVIPRKYWTDYIEPPLLDYDISIALPSVKQMKNTVDRMKTMSPHLIVKANTSGNFILQIKTDLVTVSSRFSALQVECCDPDFNNDADEDDNCVICRVDIKTFSNYLLLNQTVYDRLICSIIHEKLIAIYLERENYLSFHSYIPSMLT